MLKKLKQDIIKKINKHLPPQTRVAAEILEYPPQPEMGDLALPCFQLVESIKIQELKNKLENFVAKNPYIKEVRIAGLYLNFFLDKNFIAQELLTSPTPSLPLKKGEGKGGGIRVYPRPRPVRSGTGRTQGCHPRKSASIVIEYVSPNSNKPLHLGHVRNGLLGEALSNVLESQGAKVIRACLVNDRGIHIVKSMLAYQKFGKVVRKPRWVYETKQSSAVSETEQWETPEKSGEKGDAFVGRYYVLYNEKLKENPSLEAEAYELLKKWEAGDKPTVALWKKMNDWALRGFGETFKNLGIRFDEIYFESQIYKKAKKRVLEYLGKKMFKRDEKGNVVADLSKFGLENKVVLRADGTSVYSTNDIELAFVRAAKVKFDKLIYVVASEQDYYFRQLFKVFEIIKAPFVEKLLHLSYGLVLLPEGKLKSREGRRVDADDLIANLEGLVGKEILKRNPEIQKKELRSRAKVLALAALKFYILQVDPKSELLFKPEESVSLLGRTGVYLEYAYARIQSILAKSEIRNPPQPPFIKGGRGGIYPKSKIQNPKSTDKKSTDELVMHLVKYDEILESAAKNFDPSGLALYLYDLAKKFNDFYEKMPVLNAPESVRTQRILFIKKIAEILKNGLEFLGIEAVKKV